MRIIERRRNDCLRTKKIPLFYRSMFCRKCSVSRPVTLHSSGNTQKILSRDLPSFELTVWQKGNGNGRKGRGKKGKPYDHTIDFDVHGITLILPCLFLVLTVWSLWTFRIRELPQGSDVIGDLIEETCRIINSFYVRNDFSKGCLLV